MRYLSVLALGLAACAPTAAEYYKPDVAAAEIGRDETYCLAHAEAHTSAPTPAWVTGQRDGLFRVCMMDRGYMPK